MENPSYHFTVSIDNKCGYIKISDNKVFETKDVSNDKTYVYAEYDETGSLVGIEFFGNCDTIVPIKL